MHFSRLMAIASTIACSAARATLQPSSTLEGIHSITELDGNDIPHALVERNPQARCGRGFGKCSDDGCCSTAGYCGKTKAHCRSPDCQIDYGHCDAHMTPDGPPTSGIPRPTIGKVPYGPKAVRSCVGAGNVALTFDDGPNKYTEDLLDLLDKYDAKVTFFITGNNNAKGPIDTPGMPWASMIERMYQSGHQIASHTWSHQDLSKITPEQRRIQILWNEVALRNILGGFPTYMRPPYSSCTAESGCLKDMGNLGYHVILYDIDTEDYSHDSPNAIQGSKDIFDKNLARGKASDKSWLVIAHDVHEQTVYNLTEHMLKKVSKDGYSMVTVGECWVIPRRTGIVWMRALSLLSFGRPSPSVLPTMPFRATVAAVGMLPVWGRSSDRAVARITIVGILPSIVGLAASSMLVIVRKLDIHPLFTNIDLKSVPQHQGRTLCCNLNRKLRIWFCL
ncbi:putative chitin deacetylase [Aspergillus nomiae NRRL 13137]|uniref:Putative chitin deacetylase n=1 Tax=Aspergillus nomiae NRRL (strain ATCC 15546 / NRRL 13137 / CBS 260.88 / M93) TaxID=1509407 RepID=A0A0L1JAX3_ASPN3|nr:putative chitin deacetylase [Aspergillus nomiae NRRL 13137]KNG88904.1 putative chitin deacetylase [Aspergillus nomiae NRRL 13137]